MDQPITNHPGDSPGPPHRRPGRHRLGAPGTIYRRSPTPPGRRRGAHHRTRPPIGAAARHLSLLVVLSIFLVSGWLTVVGATAFAQMYRP